MTVETFEEHEARIYKEYLMLHGMSKGLRAMLDAAREHVDQGKVHKDVLLIVNAIDSFLDDYDPITPLVINGNYPIK